MSANFAEWVVLDSELIPRGRALLPLRTTPEYIDGPTLWAVELDAFEVPWLVRLHTE